MQQTHCVEGLRIADLTVLRDMAVSIGLNANAFESEYSRLSGAATQEHIAASRSLLNQVGGQRFPTFALDDGKGHLTALDIGAYLGRPQEPVAHLARMVAEAQPKDPPGATQSMVRGPDRCVLPT